MDGRIFAARELVESARRLLAEWQYSYDVTRPKGQGWENPPEGKEVDYRYRKWVGPGQPPPEKEEPVKKEEKAAPQNAPDAKNLIVPGKGQVQNNESQGEKKLIEDFVPVVQEMFEGKVKIFGDAYKDEEGLSPEEKQQRRQQRVDANAWFRHRFSDGKDEKLNKISRLIFDSPRELARLKKRLEAMKPGTVKSIENESFKPDMVIEKVKDSSLPFTVVIESDGKQHESQRKDEHGFSFTFLDRAKEKLVRETKKALVIRLKSDEHTGKQASFILKNMMTYNESIGKDCPVHRRRQMLQEYIDAMCFDFAGENKNQKDHLVIKTSPEEYIEEKKQEAVKKYRENDSPNHRFTKTQVKLLNIQVTDRRLLKGVFSIWNKLERSKNGVLNDRELMFKKSDAENAFGFVTDIVKRCRRIKKPPHASQVPSGQRIGVGPAMSQ